MRTVPHYCRSVFHPAPYLGQAKTKYGKYKGQWDIGRWYSVVFSRGKLGNK
jgi:hypothetical protein